MSSLNDAKVDKLVSASKNRFGGNENDLPDKQSEDNIEGKYINIDNPQPLYRVFYYDKKEKRILFGC